MGTETHITSAGQRETVTCGPRTYTLRPITYGEAARLAEAEAQVFQGGPAMLAEIVREALTRTLGQEKAAPAIEAVDAHEEADIALTAAVITRPHPQETPEAWTAWRGRMEEAQRDLMRAQLRRARVERKVAQDPDVLAARVAMLRAETQRRTALLALALVDCATPVEELPAADVEALFARAQAMSRPGVTEGKA